MTGVTRGHKAKGQRVRDNTAASAWLSSFTFRLSDLRLRGVQTSELGPRYYLLELR